MQHTLEKVYDVKPEDKVDDHWLMPYLARMDPETQYEEMISIFAQYSLDKFGLQYIITCGTIHNIQKTSGAETLSYTNKIVRRPNRRNEDGLGFFWTWFACGPSHPATRASIVRLNDMHMKIAKALPGNFSDNDEFVYTLCMIGILQDRIMEKLGLPGMPPFLKIAMHHELRDICAQFHSENGAVHSFPADFEGMKAFADQFDARDFGPGTEVHRSVANAMIHDFATRFFPEPLHAFGRNMVIFALKDQIIERYGLGALSPEEREATAQQMRAVFEEKLSAPDRKESFLDSYAPADNQSVIEADRAFAKVADSMGWIKGGEATLAITRAA